LFQFDIILKDFANWKLENDELIERFRAIDSKIYRRLEPVIAVLNYTYQRAIHQGALNEDLETIFNVGLNYLNTQFEVIKIYYQTLFESKCNEIEEYGILVNYLLFINDFRSDLERFEDYVEIEKLDEVETLIEDMIAQRDNDVDTAKEALDKAIMSVAKLLDYEYTPIIDIFYEIAKSLGIGLSDDDHSIIGKDI
jgi:hypothetical protein